MSVQIPVVAIAFGSVAPSQGDVVELKLHLGCTNEVSSFEVVLQNFDGRFSPNGANALSVGLDGSISVGRGANCPMLMTCRVEGVKYESTSTESYVRVLGRCWGERLFRRVVTKAYMNVKGEDIVKDLLDYYVGLSHVRNSTELVEATDTTYMSLSYEDTPVMDILKYVAETSDKQGVIGYDFRIAPDGKFEFFPRNIKPSSVSLTGRVEQSEYGKDVFRVRNKITVYGTADKSVPTDKDTWTESLTPAEGTWTAVAGAIRLDSLVFLKGSHSIALDVNNSEYGNCLFTLATGHEVDANLYPELHFAVARDSLFAEAFTVLLYDTSDRTAACEFIVGNNWCLQNLKVGAANADTWIVQSGFDWTHLWRVGFVGYCTTQDAGSFHVDNLFFGGRRYTAMLEDAASQASYGLREQVEANEELWSDTECTGRAQALLANLKDPAESLTLRSTVLDYAATPILAGDTIHVALPMEGVNADFRVLSAEYRVDGATQTLETTLELGREAPLLADYIMALRSRTDNLSRYKAPRR